MQIDFSDLMSKKSDEGLQRYIDDISKFVPEAIEAAIAEFQKRGRIFSAEELSMLNAAIQERKDALEREESKGFERRNWEENIVDEIDAPTFYSEKAIFIFSTAFGVLFGSVLLAINLNRLKLTKGATAVIFFGIGYSILQFSFLQIFQRNSFAVPLSMAGAGILDYFFWRKYIGQTFKYRANPVWVPMVIGVILWCIIFYIRYKVYSPN